VSTSASRSVSPSGGPDCSGGADDARGGLRVEIGTTVDGGAHGGHELLVRGLLEHVA
jgi:hypothetical protein